RSVRCESDDQRPLRKPRSRVTCPREGMEGADTSDECTPVHSYLPKDVQPDRRELPRFRINAEWTRDRFSRGGSLLSPAGDRPLRGPASPPEFAWREVGRWRESPRPIAQGVAGLKDVLPY